MSHVSCTPITDLTSIVSTILWRHIELDDDDDDVILSSKRLRQISSMMSQCVDPLVDFITQISLSVRLFRIIMEKDDYADVYI